MAWQAHLVDFRPHSEASDQTSVVPAQALIGGSLIVRICSENLAPYHF